MKLVLLTEETKQAPVVAAELVHGKIIKYKFPGEIRQWVRERTIDAFQADLQDMVAAIGTINSHDETHPLELREILQEYFNRAYAQRKCTTMSQERWNGTLHSAWHCGVRRNSVDGARSSMGTVFKDVMRYCTKPATEEYFKVNQDQVYVAIKAAYREHDIAVPNTKHERDGVVGLVASQLCHIFILNKGSYLTQWVALVRVGPTANKQTVISLELQRHDQHTKLLAARLESHKRKVKHFEDQLARRADLRNKLITKLEGKSKK